MARGQLRVYLGAAPGVGKTYAMLNEGWRRRRRGTDVVVGYVETHGRAETAAQLRDLEIVAPALAAHAYAFDAYARDLPRAPVPLPRPAAPGRSRARGDRDHDDPAQLVRERAVDRPRAKTVAFSCWR